MNDKIRTSAIGILVSVAIASVGGFSTATAGQLSALPKNRVQDGARVKLLGQTNTSALKSATLVGPRVHTASMNLTIGLKLRNVTKLKQFLSAVLDPNSAQYHHFLTPQEFTQKYGPTKAQVAQVAQYLKARGIQIKNVARNNLLIHTQASTGAYEHALGVKINNYKLHGRSFFSTMDSPEFPASVAGVVQSVIGLNNAALMRPMSFHGPLNLKENTHASATGAPAPSTSIFSPAQLAQAYDWPSITTTVNGSGVTVAIITADASGLSSDQDPHDFWSSYGLPDHKINVVPVDGDNGLTDGMVETLLDIEYSGAMGPGITQEVYVASSAYASTFTDAFNKFVNDDNAQVMTTSWGEPEADAPTSTDEAIFMQGAAEGISMFAAAGDHGSSDGTSAPDTADYPSASAYITAANGTHLNISDLKGDYGSETVWNDSNCFGNGPAATGGAISSIIEKPSWQQGPGVPSNIAMRMNSDVALSASCSHPMQIYVDGGFINGGIAGTSAVAPMLAGLFAIGVSQQPNDASLGQSNALIYDDVNAGNYATDFHDITVGNNGAFQAEPNWDHASGWGSLDATKLLSHLGTHGPSGTLSGTVTDAATGKPVPNAQIVINPGAYHLKAGSDGTFSTPLNIGSYSIAVSAYGYTTDTEAVNITDGNTTTENFALETAPMETLSGEVKDGSGHGWPLYSEIKIFTSGYGQVADLWTDPETGKYSINLPKGNTYTENVTAYRDGYNSGSATQTLNSNMNQVFSLTVSASCKALGYANPFGADFNGTFPPKGWTVKNAVSDSPVVWKSNTSYVRDNYTGGDGSAAMADSNDSVPYQGSYDTSLISPPIPVTSLHGDAMLTYKANYMEYSSEALDLGISTDGGKSWTNVSHWTSNHGGGVYSLPGENETVNLGPYLPVSGSFKLRWRYYDLSAGYDFYAQIDDVAIGGCVPVPGGMLRGHIIDAANGADLSGATVNDDSSDSSTLSFNNLNDSDHPGGLYALFLKSGNHSLTVTDGSYSDATTSVNIANNANKIKDFTLAAPSFSLTPSGMSFHVVVNGQQSKEFTLLNTGTGTGEYDVLPVNAPPSLADSSHLQGNPRQEVKLPFADGSVVEQSGTYGVRDFTGTSTPFSLQPLNSNGWMNVSDYPSSIFYNLVLTDPSSGLVYSVYGSNDITLSGTPLASGYAFDSDTGTWSPIANAPFWRLGPTGGFIGGKLYVVNGVGYFPTAVALDIYNPATNTWSSGANNPNPAGVGSASAVIGSKLYVVGGCPGIAYPGYTCQATPKSTFEIYDETTDSWRQGPDYPHPVAFQACGAIAGKLYCAGGVGYSSSYSDGYMYDPSHPDAGWKPIAKIPALGGFWGSSYAVSQGELLISGGVIHTNELTNAGMAYNPDSNSWSSLPNANDLTFGGGTACGFYRVGGMTVENKSLAASAAVEKLPSYPCDSEPTPYITLSPAMGTLAAGDSAKVTVTIDGTGQKPNTQSVSYLRVTGSPESSPLIPVTVSWDPAPVDLSLSGDVSPTGTVSQGADLTYNLAVKNLKEAGTGPATQTVLTFPLPAGISYLGASGDGSCTAPAGSTSASAAATSGSDTVVCDLGTVDNGSSKVVTLMVQATTDEKTVSGTFSVTSEEQDNNTSNNSLTLSTNADTGPAGPRGPAGSSGGGSFGWAGLAGLSMLMLLTVDLRRRRIGVDTR